MIITEKKPLAELLKLLEGKEKLFLVCCGECAATCKTGGEPEMAELKRQLEGQGKTIVGMCLPEAPCIAAKVKAELAKNMASLRQAEAVLVLACGLGAQSVKDNDRLNLAVYPALNTVFGAVMDAQGNFYEKCSFCGECVLGVTAGICPVTLCSKGLLNGPCGGVNKGKCETDKDKDCAWVLIYRALEKKGKLAQMREALPPKDHVKARRPRSLILNKQT